MVIRLHIVYLSLDEGGGLRGEEGVSVELARTAPQLA